MSETKQSQNSGTAQRTIDIDDISGVLHERSITTADSDEMREQVGMSDDQLRNLCRSLSAVQTDPITVRETENGYELIEGYRRYQAVQRFGDVFGVSELRAEIRDMNDHEAIRARLTSNEFRHDVLPSERAELVAELKEEYGSAEAVADFLGMSTAWIYSQTAMLDWSEQAQKAVDAGLSTNAVSRVENNIEDGEEREEILQQAAEDGLSEDEINELVTEKAGHNEAIEDIQESLNRIEDHKSDIQELEKKLKTHEQLSADIQELENQRDKVLARAKVQDPERLSEYQEAYEDVSRLKSDVTAAQDAREIISDQIEFCENQASELEDDAQRVDELQDELATIKERFGVLPENEGTFSVAYEETENGLVNFRLQIKRADPVEAISEVRRVFSEGETAEKVESEIEQSESRKQRHARFETAARDMKNDISVLQKVPEFSVADIEDERTRTVIESAIDKGLSPAELEDMISEVENKIQETLDSVGADTVSELEEIGGMIAEDDMAEQYQEIQEDLSEARNELDQYSPENIKNTIKNKENAIQNTHAEKAQEAFNQLPDAQQEELLNELSADYSIDVASILMADDSDDDSDTEADDSDDDSDTEGNDTVEIIPDDGSPWATITDGNRELRAYKKHSEDIVDEWQNDGYEAAENMKEQLQ